jgi:SAM-dependent methyltransferase
MSGGYGSNEVVTRVGQKNAALRFLISLLYPPMPTLNIIPKRSLENIQKELFRPGAMVVNIGSGGMSGCGYRLWDGLMPPGINICHLDIEKAPTVTLVGDAHRLPFEDGSIDGLICQAVIEHVKNPQKVVDEAQRVLKPGGVLYLEVPFLQGFHADPYDFQRYTLEGLRVLTHQFDERVSGVSVGPVCALIWLLRDGLSSCFTNSYLYFFSRFTLGWLLSPFRYLDFLVRHNRAATRLACEYYFLCQKAS